MGWWSGEIKNIDHLNPPKAETEADPGKILYV